MNTQTIKELSKVMENNDSNETKLTQVKQSSLKQYGKMGQTWLAKDGSGFAVGVIIGKYFDGKNGLSYCLKSATKLLEVRRGNLLSLIH